MITSTRRTSPLSLGSWKRAPRPHQSSDTDSEPHLQHTHSKRNKVRRQRYENSKDENSSNESFSSWKTSSQDNHRKSIKITVPNFPLYQLPKPPHEAKLYEPNFATVPDI
jgi:hypothetical protein